jgi:hypothetical protein
MAQKAVRILQCKRSTYQRPFPRDRNIKARIVQEIRRQLRSQKTLAVERTKQNRNGRPIADSVPPPASVVGKTSPVACSDISDMPREPLSFEAANGRKAQHQRRKSGGTSPGN